MTERVISEEWIVVNIRNRVVMKMTEGWIVVDIRNKIGG